MTADGHGDVAEGLAKQLRYAQAINKIARIITHDGDAARIRRAMVQIIGETLDVDRTLIYDIRFDDEVADGLCEWLNPAAEGIEPTIATYPLSVFIGGATHVRKTRRWIESHADDRHPSLKDDGSGEVLHKTMCIQSLLWFPFDFEEARFFLLVFNQVCSKRTWSASDMAFVEDVAELVSMAHLRLRLESRRQEQQQRSEQLKRLEGLGLLAGGIAHDFNNLLTAILGNASLVDDQLPSENAARRNLQKIEEAATCAAEMCKQLLTYSGRADPALSRIDLNALAKETAALLEVSVQRALHLQLGGEPLWVMGDRSQLQQVLLNLLTNASDALRAEGTITLRSGLLTEEQAGKKSLRSPSAWVADERPYLEVEDDGAGMDAATQARIFEPFYTTKDTGHGLGLAAVHGVLERHDAAIGVRSAVGDGTAFTIVFPNVKSQANEESAPQPRPSSPGDARVTVLVVDDEPMVRGVCESSLALAGYRVLTAESGEQALSTCREAQPPVDVVVLDIGLPGLDGRQTLAALREAGHGFPVVMISAYPFGDGFDDASSGRWTFLQKPFRPDDLLATVVQMLPH